MLFRQSSEDTQDALTLTLSQREMALCSFHVGFGLDAQTLRFA